MPAIDAKNICAWQRENHALDDQITALQDAKKCVYERIRLDYSLKIAERMKVAGMDSRKREEHFLFSDLGREFFKLIEANSGAEAEADDQAEPAHEYDGAWRADRDREGAEPFEPETGEVLDEDDEGELNAEADGKIVAFTCRTATHNGINPTCW